MPHIYGLASNELEHVETARRVSQEVALPAAAEVDEQARFPAESLRALGEAGLLGLCIDGEFGGRGQGPRTFAAVTEEIAQGCPSTAMIYVMHVSAAQALAASGVWGNRGVVLKDVAAGKHLTTLAFSERGSRSQFWAPVSRLEPVDGDAYVTNAQKSWITSANHADSYLSTAQKPDADSPLDSTLYLVRRGAEGVRVDGGFDGLGLRGNDSAPVALENLRVSRSDLITEPGDGAQMILEVVLPWFAVGTAAMAHGLCLGALQRSAGHLTGAKFDHDGRKLRDLPNLRARLGEMQVRTDQSRALLGFALTSMQQPDEQTPVLVLQARLSALEAALYVTDLAMKACGGAAFSKHLAVERLFRDARAGWVMAPTADHLLEFIGRALTGLTLF